MRYRNNLLQHISSTTCSCIVHARCTLGHVRSRLAVSGPSRTRGHARPRLDHCACARMLWLEAHADDSGKHLFDSPTLHLLTSEQPEPPVSDLRTASATLKPLPGGAQNTRFWRAEYVCVLLHWRCPPVQPSLTGVPTVLQSASATSDATKLHNFLFSLQK